MTKIKARTTLRLERYLANLEVPDIWKITGEGDESVPCDRNFARYITTKRMLGDGEQVRVIGNNWFDSIPGTESGAAEVEERERISPRSSPGEFGRLLGGAPFVVHEVTAVLDPRGERGTQNQRFLRARGWTYRPGGET